MRGRGTHTFVPYLIGAVVLLVVAAAGHYLEDRVAVIEAAIDGLGGWAPAAFVGLYVVASQILVPESLLDTAAGAFFGVLWGTVYSVVASVIGASIAFCLSRWLLRSPVSRLLEKRPSLAAIDRVADHGGLRLLLLLRLAPLNPVVVSYALGVTRVAFSRFLFACIGLVPTHLVTVYFGYVARHLARPSEIRSPEHTAAIVAGLLVCAAAMWWIGRVAYAEIKSAEQGD